MKSRKDGLFLNDIVECCQNIGGYLLDITEAEFKANRMLQDAVVRNIEIIGEASKNLSESLRDNNPQIEWRDVMRMRDKIVHHYFRLNIDIIWLTVTQDIPQLQKKVEQIVLQLP